MMQRMLKEGIDKQKEMIKKEQTYRHGLRLIGCAHAAGFELQEVEQIRKVIGFYGIVACKMRRESTYSDL